MNSFFEGTNVLILKLDNKIPSILFKFDKQSYIDLLLFAVINDFNNYVENVFNFVDNEKILLSEFYNNWLIFYYSYIWYIFDISNLIYFRIFNLKFINNILDDYYFLIADELIFMTLEYNYCIFNSNKKFTSLMEMRIEKKISDEQFNFIW